MQFFGLLWTGRIEVGSNNKVWDKEELIDLVKTRRAVWIKRKYDIKDYVIDDFKRSLEV